MKTYLRDQVFVAGGQPQITYVERQEIHVERNLARAIATPSQVVCLSGPTKTGKTVLCNRVLVERLRVWVDAGKINTSDEFWNHVCADLNLPLEVAETEEAQYSGQVGINIPIVTASGSRIKSSGLTTKQRIVSMSQALAHCIDENIILVIDDFHYLDPDIRATLMRNIKGAVFKGLKVILLSVTHRTFDAIKAEAELTGRFASVILPDWTKTDLIQIPMRGFQALNVRCNETIIDSMADEAQESPFLMQRFCWEVSYDCGVEQTRDHIQDVDSNYNLKELYVRIALDAGLPVYQKLVAGPQSRKVRTKRPLRTGSEADIYEATLLAIAETGPKAAISYEELRTTLNGLLTDMMPQKHEITSALKHLAAISMKSESIASIDWDEDKRKVNIADPFLRFFLRWQVRKHGHDDKLSLV